MSREAEPGAKAMDLCRKHGSPEPRFYSRTFDRRARRINDGAHIGLRVHDPLALIEDVGSPGYVFPKQINAALLKTYYQANDGAGAYTYPYFAPYGTNGGYYYGRVTVTF